MRGLSPVQVVDHGKTILFYSADLEHYEIVRVKVGKRGVNTSMCERVQASQIGFSTLHQLGK